MDKSRNNDLPSVWDKIVRIIYGIAGLLCLAVSGWFLFFVSPFNPYGFWGFLVAGLILLGSGAKATVRDIFFLPFP